MVGSEDSSNCCPNCDRTFETDHGLRTHFGSVHEGALPNRNCSQCGAEFYAEYEKRYCSEPCLDEGTSYSGAENPNYRGGTTVGTFELCEANFEYYPSTKEGIYCPKCVRTEQWRTPPTATGSQNPRWNGGKQRRQCVVCGASVERYPSDANKVTVCGETCRRKWLSEAFAGDGHPNWQGGGNGSYGKGWNAVRRRALERDDYRCVVCDATKAEIGRNPDVHHLVPVRQFVNTDEYTRADAHFLDNVVSLCVRCHRKADFNKIGNERLRALRDNSK